MKEMFKNHKIFLSIKANWLFLLLLPLLMSSLSLCLSFSSPNLTYFASSAYYKSQEKTSDDFCELSVFNKNASPDYYYLDYQFSFEQYEDYRDTYYSPSIFVFKSYGRNVQLNKNGEIDRFFYSTGFSNNGNVDILNAFSAKLVNRELKYVEDYYGVKFLSNKFVGYEVPNTCVLSYNVAKKYLNKDTLSKEECVAILGQKIVLEDNVINSQPFKNELEIIGVMDEFDSATKIPMAFREMIFISSITALRTPSKIYFKMPKNLYTATTWIDGLFENFDTFNGYSVNQKDFDLYLRFLSLEDKEPCEIASKAIEQFNISRIFGQYTVFSIVFLVLMIIIFITLCLQKNRIKKFVIENGAFEMLFSLFLTALLSLCFVYLFTYFISLLLFCVPFGRFSSQFYIIIYILIIILCLLFNLVFRRKKYGKKDI